LTACQFVITYFKGIKNLLMEVGLVMDFIGVCLYFLLASLIWMETFKGKCSLQHLPRTSCKGNLFYKYLKRYHTVMFFC